MTIPKELFLSISAMHHILIVCSNFKATLIEIFQKHLFVVPLQNALFDAATDPFEAQKAVQGI